MNEEDFSFGHDNKYLNSAGVYEDPTSLDGFEVEELFTEIEDPIISVQDGIEVDIEDGSESLVASLLEVKSRNLITCLLVDLTEQVVNDTLTLVLVGQEKDSLEKDLLDYLTDSPCTVYGDFSSKENIQSVDLLSKLKKTDLVGRHIKAEKFELRTLISLIPLASGNLSEASEVLLDFFYGEDFSGTVVYCGPFFHLKSHEDAAFRKLYTRYYGASLG